MTKVPTRSTRRQRRQPAKPVLGALTLLATLGTATTTEAETWRGLTVAPEHRCSTYDRKHDYRYPQSIEQDIVRKLGGVLAPTPDDASPPRARPTSSTSWRQARRTIPAFAGQTWQPERGSPRTSGTSPSRAPR